MPIIDPWSSINLYSIIAEIYSAQRKSTLAQWNFLGTGFPLCMCQAICFRYSDEEFPFRAQRELRSNWMKESLIFLQFITCSLQDATQLHFTWSFLLDKAYGKTIVSSSSYLKSASLHLKANLELYAVRTCMQRIDHCRQHTFAFSFNVFTCNFGIVTFHVL